MARSSGQASSSVPVDVEIVAPVDGFGSILTADLEPRVQFDWVYGALTNTHRVLTASGGSVVTTAGTSVAACTTGTTVGAYAVAQGRQFIRYQPGQPLLLEWTAAFTSPVADSQQFGGGFTATEGILVGYKDLEFGVMRRLAGACAIHRLTVTVGTTGAETVTITLAGVAFPVAAGAGLSTSGLAQFIAAQTFAGWSATQPQAVGATVTFLQDVPAVVAGAFTLASSGTAAGTIATILAGAANVVVGDDVWIPRASWNGDRCDGTGRSRFTANWTFSNVFRAIVPYLGAGAVLYQVMGPRGRWITMHTIERPSTSISPIMKNPSVRMGAIAASLGSSTNLVVTTASAAAFRSGPSQLFLTPPEGALRANMTVSATETTAIVVRVRSEFRGVVNLRELLPHTAGATSVTTARNVEILVYINPVLGAGAVTYTNASESSVDVAYPSVAITSGTPIQPLSIAGAGSGELELHEHEMRLQAGDTLVLTARANGAAEVDVWVNWHKL